MRNDTKSKNKLYGLGMRIPTKGNNTLEFFSKPIITCYIMQTLSRVDINQCTITSLYQISAANKVQNIINRDTPMDICETHFKLLALEFRNMKRNNR